MKKIVSTIIIALLFLSYTSAQETEVKKLENWKFGLHFNTLTDKERAFNGLTKGVIIYKVSKDYSAEAAGVLVGDILTHVNGIEIIDQAHCAEVVKNVDVSSGESMLKIIRNGVKMEISVKFE